MERKFWTEKCKIMALKFGLQIYTIIYKYPICLRYLRIFNGFYLKTHYPFILKPNFQPILADKIP